MTLGENIKEHRKAKGLTQKELAQRVGLATGTIQQYELNKRTPNLNTMKKIADVIDMKYEVTQLGSRKIVMPEVFVPQETIDRIAKNLALSARQAEAALLSQSDHDALDHFRPLNDTNKDKALDYMELLKFRQDADPDKNK